MLESLITDKQWFIKHALVFAVIGLSIAAILMGAFLFYRFTLPVEQSLERNWYVTGTAIVQAVLFVASFIVGLCLGRTATQGGQIAIIMFFLNDANALLTVFSVFSVMALVYGFQNDALRAGSCMAAHLLGTAFTYLGPTGSRPTLLESLGYLPHYCDHHRILLAVCLHASRLQRK